MKTGVNYIASKQAEAIKAGLCAMSPLSVKKWWLENTVFPYINKGHPYKTSLLCEYFGVSIRRFMFWKWHTVNGMSRHEAITSR